MKFFTTIKTNKRGKPYNTRPTRLANGIMKHYGNKGVPEDMLRLAVFGTFDVLAKASRFDMLWITVMHPTDPSYTKRVRILTKNKRKFINRIPKDERNTNRYLNK